MINTVQSNNKIGLVELLLASSCSEPIAVPGSPTPRNAAPIAEAYTPT